MTDRSALFDVYLFVDWSGSSRPKSGKDSIWIGEILREGPPIEANPPTRAGATDHLRSRLIEHAGAGRRVLVGFDFPYGYPRGLARALGQPEGGWRAIWREWSALVIDDETNANNRFDVASALNDRASASPWPFWTCPPAKRTPTLTPTRSKDVPEGFAHGATLARLRTTESCLRGVQETWKLLGAGSVGSQAMLGIPRLHALRTDPALRDVTLVWPFETGFVPSPLPADRLVLHAEIWPGIVDPAALAKEVTGGAIRDQAQVRLMCRWACEEDTAGTLGAWFDRPAGLSDEDAAAAVAEEGWILGGPGPG